MIPNWTNWPRTNPNAEKSPRKAPDPANKSQRARLREPPSASSPGRPSGRSVAMRDSALAPEVSPAPPAVAWRWPEPASGP